MNRTNRFFRLPTEGFSASAAGVNGIYGHTHGRHHFSCFDNVLTLPKILDDSGYRTACIGKKHYAPRRLFPFHADFEIDPNEALYGRDDVRMAETCRSVIADNAQRPFFLYFCPLNPNSDGRLLGAGRALGPGRDDGHATLFWIDPEKSTMTKLAEFAGTSYPGIAEDDGMIWVTYISSACHEDKWEIHLAKIKIPDGNHTGA